MARLSARLLGKPANIGRVYLRRPSRVGYLLLSLISLTVVDNNRYNTLCKTKQQSCYPCMSSGSGNVDQDQKL